MKEMMSSSMGLLSLASPIASSSLFSPAFSTPPPCSPAGNPTISHWRPHIPSPWIPTFQTCLRLSNPSCSGGIVVHAKRKSSDAIASAEELLDPDFRVSLNELSTEAVKVMLSEQRKRVQAFREKVDGLENLLAKEGDSDAALFMFVIKGMLDHKIVQEVHDLKGTYKKAFAKICGVLEDSGWLLKADDDETGVKMVDDELIPPILQSQY